MSINLDAEVLIVTMNTWAVPIIIKPLVSQPGVPAYASRGVWTVEPYTIIQENSQPLITSIFTVGLRLAELPIPPMVGDVVIINGDSYWFDSQKYDGQGGVSWTVKAFGPLQQTPLQ